MSKPELLTRWIRWGVAAVLLLGPAAALYFADELERHFRGFYVYISGFEVVTGLNGLDYLCAVVAVCLLARGVALGVMWLMATHRNPRRTVQLEQLRMAGDPFASWPVLLVLGCAVATILLSYIFGSLALGRGAPVRIAAPISRLAPAAVFMNKPSSMASNPDARVFIADAFASSAYEFRISLAPSTTSPNSVGSVSHTYEGYGWPLRCIFSPGDHSSTQNILWHRFFSPRSDSFILNSLAHTRLSALPFAVNTAVLALLIWALWTWPAATFRILRKRSRDRQGKCLHCGYILNGLDRCPECGGTGSLGMSRVVLSPFGV